MNYFKENIKFLSESNKFNRERFSLDTDIYPQELHALINGTDPKLEQLVVLSKYWSFSIDDLIKQNLDGGRKANPNLKLLALDVDGVLTDGGIFYTESGDMIKQFNTKDGMGMQELCKKGFPVGIISSSLSSKMIENRANGLKITKVYVGKRNKLEVLQEWCEEMNIGLENVAFIGDDINDICVMEKVGVAACPANAMPVVKAVANIILTRNGGDACVREFIETYIPVAVY